jgi:hypothetical protein
VAELALELEQLADSGRLDEARDEAGDVVDALAGALAEAAVELGDYDLRADLAGEAYSA